jgi:hypothetical protein
MFMSLSALTVTVAMVVAPKMVAMRRVSSSSER